MRPFLRALTSVCALGLLFPTSSHALTTVVPDDFATLQEAVDSPAETVLVRSGSYPAPVKILRKYVWQSLIVTHPENAPNDPPRVGSIDLEPDQPFLIRGLVIAGMVRLRTGNPAHLGFEDCVLDSGLVQISVGDAWNAGSLSMRGGIVRGGVSAVADNGNFDGVRFIGGGLALDGESGIEVQRCTFQGTGSGTAILLQSPAGRGLVHDNTIENYAVGIATSRMGQEFASDVQRNVIRRCGTGVALGGEGLRVAGNEVSDCGAGIHVVSHHGASIVGNLVLRSATAGITMLLDDRSVCAGNVVGRSNGDGISIRSAYAPCEITSNTVYENGGAGIAIFTDFKAPDGEFPTSVGGNIGYGNRGSGLSWINPQTARLSCNVWYANEGGATSGVPPSATDLDIDPRFCALEKDDVSLRSDSPVLVAACGTIGARGMGCDATTEVLVATLFAERSAEGVAIHWRLGGDEQIADAWIERAESRDGPWLRIATERAHAGDVTIDWDREAGRAERWYRLAWIAENGPGHSAAIEAGAASPFASFDLRLIGPNPARGRIAIEYALPRAEPIVLDVIDVTGRRVAQLASGTMPGGIHSAVWDGQTRGSAAKPGLYFVRLRHPGGEPTLRVLLRR